MADPPLSLADGMRQTRLTYDQLWTLYLALGGTHSLGRLREYVERRRSPDDHEHNVIAQALNEIFDERGHDHPVAYRQLYRRR